MNNIAKYLAEVVYGGNDGIITTFAVVAGFNGAQINNSQMLELSFATVLLFGLANLFADALSMGVGSFLSVRSGLDVSRSKTTEYELLLQQNPTELESLTLDVLQTQGLDSQDSNTQVELFKQNPRYWYNFLITSQGLGDPEQVKPIVIGLVTFAAFTLFGVIPLLPYLLNVDPKIAFLASIVLTLVAMLTLAIVRAKVSNTTNAARAILENLLIGGLAAVVAFIVGTLFS